MNKEDLIKHAKEYGADKELESLLQELPEDEYETPAEINKAIGKIK